MPTPTQKLGIPKPLGNETVSRAAFNEILDTIDQKAASQAALDAHIADHNNPHQVTAEQVGAIPDADGAVDLNHIASSAKTSPGGTEANRLAVTNASGRVGDSERLGGVPASSFARKDANETWTGRPTFAAGIQIGDGNQDLADVFALLLPRDSRSIVVTQWDATFPDKPKQIQIKDGSTVVATIDVLARNSEGKATQIRATAGSWSRTWTATWTSGRSWPDSVT